MQTTERGRIAIRTRLIPSGRTGRITTGAAVVKVANVLWPPRLQLFVQFSIGNVRNVRPQVRELVLEGGVVVREETSLEVLGEYLLRDLILMLKVTWKQEGGGGGQEGGEGGQEDEGEGTIWFQEPDFVLIISEVRKPFPGRSKFPKGYYPMGYVRVAVVGLGKVTMRGEYNPFVQLKI